MVFNLIAQSFAPLPLYPLHAPQAGPQKSSQICVLLLQVASFDDFNDVSDIILIASPCTRPHFDDILMYSTRFGPHFLLSGNFFHNKSENDAPAHTGSTILHIATKHLSCKIPLFRRRNGSARRPANFLWRAHGPLDPSKKHTKTYIKSTFPLFGPTKPPHIGIKLAIERFSDPIFIFRPSFSPFFMKMCSPPTQEAQF